MEWMARVSPELDPPRHLAPIVDVIERATREEARVVISAPPQHGKSTLVLHALVWLLLRHPSKRNAYVTYAAQVAQDQMYRARLIAERAGLEAQATLDRWRTREGGGVVATGIGGPLTGYAVDGLLIVDDYVKNRVEAESPTYRERAWEWFTSVALTRVHPGASVVVVATRWHPDDLAGRLIAKGWEHITLPAIDEEGRPLWPEKRPQEWLEAVRREIGEYDWAALYMGEPRPRGGAVFGPPHYYDELPSGGYREATGVDLAYTKRTSSDYSVAISGRFHEGRLYITRVWRAQVRAEEAARVLVSFPEPRYWHAGGTEQGVVDLMWALGVRINALPARGDKFTRAQRAASAWNEGRILVPREASWLSPFLAELESFTGLDDPHDDQVDALAALWQGLSARIGLTPEEQRQYAAV